MRKNAGLKSFEEAEEALRQGNTLYYKEFELSYQKQFVLDGESPYRRTFIDSNTPIAGYWQYVDKWEIEVPWQEDIGDGVLCWVPGISIPVLIIEYCKSINQYRSADAAYGYDKAKPLTIGEAKKYIRG